MSCYLSVVIDDVTVDAPAPESSPFSSSVAWLKSAGIAPFAQSDEAMGSMPGHEFHAVILDAWKRFYASREWCTYVLSGEKDRLEQILHETGFLSTGRGHPHAIERSLERALQIGRYADEHGARVTWG